MNWDDLQAFVAVARLGSLRRAAESLDVTQPTVARRVRLLEASLGFPLFERDRSGHRLTAAGERMMPDALAVERAARRVEARGGETVEGLMAHVRLSVNAWPARLLAGALGALPEGLTLELAVTENTAHLARREADLAVRHGLPETGDHVTRKAGTLETAVYAGGELARHLDGQGLDRLLAEAPWIGFTEEQEHYGQMRWLAERRGHRVYSARVSETTLQQEAVAGAAGVAILPCRLAAADPRLVRLTDPIDDLAADYWIIVHRDLARVASIRRVIDWVVGTFQGDE